MKRVFVCSPFKAPTSAGREANLVRAREVCRELVYACKAPIAPHLLYPQFLDDDVTLDRDLGLAAGLSWLRMADELVVVGEATEGMQREIEAAVRLGVAVRRRQ